MKMFMDYSDRRAHCTPDNKMLNEREARVVYTLLLKKISIPGIITTLSWSSVALSPPCVLILMILNEKVIDARDLSITLAKALVPLFSTPFQ